MGNKIMNPKKLIFIPIAILVLSGCSLPLFQKSLSPSNPPGNSSHPEADIQKSFPVDPGSRMTTPDTSNPVDTSGSFIIQSQSSMAALVKYYDTQLPRQGWILRYTDANFTGGVTQYWKKDNIYLSVNIGFDQGMLNIHCQYERVEAQLAQKLPKGFPLPSQFEMVQASDSSWEFYIPQDYSAVTNFYKGQMASLNWKQNPGNGAGGQGGCGDPGCGGSPTFPAGAMPTATIDYRNENDLSYTMPDGNVVELTITPHTDGTILDVNLTLNNVASAGLPQDVPIYPGATAQIITPGSAEFQVNADLKTIEDYYNQQLPSAGWTPSGSPMEVPGSYMQDWIKGSQNITITLVTSNANTMLMIECSTCSQ